MRNSVIGGLSRKENCRNYRNLRWSTLCKKIVTAQRSGMTANMNEIFLAIALGLLAVTIIDVLGSITSRTWNYHYSYLSPLSFSIYFLIGYYVSQNASLTWALLISCIVGVYDGTIGWRLAIMLNANLDAQKDAALKTDTPTRMLYMIFISTFFAFIGSLIAR